MAHGLLEILRFFLLALIWSVLAYAVRVTFSEGRRYRLQRRELAEASGGGSAGEVQPSPERRPALRLRVLEPQDRKGASYDLGREVTLGRASDCVVSLAGDSYASSLHARVSSRGGEIWIEDLGSTNGTFVNEQRLEGPARLRRGDRVRVGGTVLEVSR